MKSATASVACCSLSGTLWFGLLVLLIGLPVSALVGQPASTLPGYPESTDSLGSILKPQSWNHIENSIDRALEWLSRQQVASGAFNAPSMGEPGITALAVMAFLSKGHLPGEGKYGRQLDRAIDSVIACQRRNGLYSCDDPGPVHVSNQHPSKSATYNHAIAGLMLTEVYGMTGSDRAPIIEASVAKALEFTRQLQARRKSYQQDLGGWRYLHPRGGADSDLSVTAWQLMFLRSAKNAEFDVPKGFIDEAMRYVISCWDEGQGVFYYTKVSSDRRWSRGMVGAGILSLALGGQHETRIAKRAGDWLVRNPFRSFGEQVGSGDRFFYGTYYCSQAMAQLGGDYWRRFYPSLAQMFLNCQQPSGAWPSEPYGSDRNFGNVYTTAMAVLSLTPPLQLLPVYQR